MFAPRSEVPRRSSPSYGASSKPLGRRRWRAAALPLNAIIVLPAAIPSEKISSDAVLDFLGSISGLLDCARFHVGQLPDVAVQVLKSMAVHEPVVLRFLM